MTLVEVVVSMSVMSVVAAAFTVGVIQVYRVTNTVEAQTNAAQQLSVAFQRLDREVAYASAISAPGQVAGDWYVEYLTGAGGTPTCVELRLNARAGQLQRRTSSDASSSAGPWLPLASNVTTTANGGTVVPPFALLPPTTAIRYPRLQVTVASRTGPASVTQRVAAWPALNATTDDRGAAEDHAEDCAGLRSVTS